MGAKCVTCPEKRRKVLRAVELFGSWKPMCFNCSGQLLAMTPMPTSIAELRLAVSRERRAKDRRYGKTDGRVFRYERRVGQRRHTREITAVIEDDMIMEVIVEEESRGLDFEGLTTIREMVSHLRPVELRALDLAG